MDGKCKFFHPEAAGKPGKKKTYVEVPRDGEDASIGVADCFEGGKRKV